MTSESDNCHSVCTLWLVRWACRSGTRDFYSALAALVGPEKLHYFHSFAPIAKPAYSKAAALGRLSLSMCLWT
jgi:hypothetical protein